jgi:hypothetical protein
MTKVTGGTGGYEAIYAKNLKLIKEGAPNVDELNHQIKHHMNIAMPAVFVVWILIVVISVLTLLNLKAPEGQELIFRRTAAAAPADVLEG